MRKIILVVIISFAVGSFGLMFGYKLGTNYRAKVDATIYLPLLVRVHQSIESGNISDARERTDMMIIAQINKYWNLKDTFLFQSVYGSKLNSNDLFQKHIKEALAIAKSGVTNLVIFSVSATNSIEFNAPTNIQDK
jgi:hypothetical protein